jgi:hypothetical protein
LLVVCEGIQGALLHGNGEVGERSADRLVGCGPQRRNGAVAVGFVQRNGVSRSSKYLKAARTKKKDKAEKVDVDVDVVALRFYRARAICGSGNDGERYVPGSRCQCDLDGEGGIGGGRLRVQ